MQFARLLKAYLIPAGVFQSVIIGGGYGTGREVVEYVTQFGAMGGLSSVGVVFAIWAVVIGLSYELARMWQTYDYRSFLKQLIGPVWVLFEIMMIVLMTIVLAVVLAAASDLIFELFAISKIISVIVLIAAVGLILCFDAGLVARLLSVWAVFVTVFLIAVLATTLVLNGGTVSEALAAADVNEGWAYGGATFAIYNIALVPLLLFAASGIESRAEALSSGVFTAFAGVIPAVFMHLALLSGYPAIIDEGLPLYYLLGTLSIPVFISIYFVVLIGTLIQTAIGFLEGVAKRINGWLVDTGRPVLSPFQRSLSGCAMLSFSAAISYFGIINLIARGYGALAWGFLFVFVLPLFTIGIYRACNHRRA